MPDLLLTNGLIWTGDDGAPWATDALIRDGRFVYVGASGDAPAHDGPTIDAGGRLVVPGLVDTHAHLMQTGFAMRNVDLKGAESVERAVALVGERASRTVEGGWVRGSGWDQHLWPGAALPTRHDLDAVAPNRPVALTHTSAHCVWANSAALQAAGVSASTEAPAGGRIERDGDGEPTGILLDTAQALGRRT